MQKKKISGMLLAALMCMLLTGCCLSHDWEEATCTAPKTCTKCGKTEGEVLAHDWAEATCTIPKTCKDCGAAEGEALGHTWTEATCTEAKTCTVCGVAEGEPAGHSLTEATYQAPAVCSICGAEDGEPLEPDFEKYGLRCDVVEGQNYYYYTQCYDNPSFGTRGTAVFTSETLASDENHPALEGYEWKKVYVDVVFDDENAWQFGVSTSSCREDYYNIKAHDDSIVYSESEYGTYGTYTVNFNGVDYTDCIQYSYSSWSGWIEQSITYSLECTFRVPVGYDGTVVGLRNANVTWEEGQYIYDLDNSETLFFRVP